MARPKEKLPKEEILEEKVTAEWLRWYQIIKNDALKWGDEKEKGSTIITNWGRQVQKTRNTPTNITEKRAVAEMDHLL